MQWIRANGVDFACSISGSGPPIILCHGGESDHRNFANFAPLLAQRLTVVNFDQRDSGATRNPAAPYSLSDLGTDVGAIVAALGWPKAHVFGTSFGGMVAMNAAISAPHRVHRLILANTWAAKGDAALPVSGATLELMQSTGEERRHEKNRLYFGSKFARNGPEAMDRALRGGMMERTPEQRARRGQTVLADASFYRLKEILAPTLILHGSDDRIIARSHAEALVSNIPSATLQVIDGAGHAITLEEPELVAEWVFEFLEGGMKA